MSLEILLQLATVVRCSPSRRRTPSSASARPPVPPDSGVLGGRRVVVFGRGGLFEGRLRGPMLHLSPLLGGTEASGGSMTQSLRREGEVAIEPAQVHLEAASRSVISVRWASAAARARAAPPGRTRSR